MNLVVPADARGQRLDQFLAGAVSELSRSRLRALIDEQLVSVDGHPMKPGHRLKGGEAIAISVPEAVAAEPEAQDLPLQVIYDDRDLLVLDKAAGMVVHPGAGNHDGTLVNALLHRVKDFKGVGGVLRPGIVHRLDKDTTGLMVVAKTDAALETLQKSFAAREVQKTYLALVRGAPPKDSGTFSTLYGRHPRARLKFTGKVKTGKSAVTHWKVLQRLDGASLIEVNLETGRTHQIRVHFAEAGMPLLGDQLYGSKPKVAPPIERQALHAWKLAFVHPRTGKLKSFEAKVPDDFAAAVKALTPKKK